MSSSSLVECIVHSLSLPHLQEGLPSPSNMKWKDVHKVVMSTDFREVDNSKLMRDLSNVTEKMQLLDEVDRIFEHNSEMYASVTDSAGGILSYTRRRL